MYDAFHDIAEKHKELNTKHFVKVVITLSNDALIY